MSAVTREVIGDVSGKLAFGLTATHFAIQDAFDGIRARRAEAADSVSELAIRLREARHAQIAAERRAAAAEAELGGALSELRLLREALRREQRVSGALKEICGV